MTPLNQHLEADNEKLRTENATLRDEVERLREALRVRYENNVCPECGEWFDFGNHGQGCKYYAIEQEALNPTDAK